MTRATFWDRFNETVPAKQVAIKAVQTEGAELGKIPAKNILRAVAELLSDPEEITKEDIATELNSRNFSLVPSRVPIFILRMDELLEVFPDLGKKDTYLVQIGKFLGKIKDFYTFQPLNAPVMAPLTAVAHSHYWIITKHPGWFSIAGINLIAPRPEDWQEWQQLIYKHFSDREITLSNDPKIITAAELIYEGKSKKYDIVTKEAKAVEDALYEEYKAEYTKLEVQDALFLAAMKFWILIKSIRAIPPGKGWEFKLRPFGYRDHYAFYTAARVGYQNRISEALRLYSIHRGIEVFFQIAGSLITLKAIGNKWPAIGEFLKGLKIVPTEEEKEEEVAPPAKAKFPWVPLAAAAGLVLLFAAGE